jgi:cation diffusion facilitator CzcD-associated flavoprotein CzcO
MPTASEIQRVCVVGAGASGLITASKLIKAGIRVTIFEKSSEIGGIWAFNPKSVTQDTAIRESFLTTSDSDSDAKDYFSIEDSDVSAVYPTLHTNLPCKLMVSVFNSRHSGNIRFLNRRPCFRRTKQSISTCWTLLQRFGEAYTIIMRRCFSFLE